MFFFTLVTLSDSQAWFGSCRQEWPASSFHRWVEREVYDLHWACGSQLCFQDIERTVGE